MKLGLIAIASPTGLGYQTKDYFDHLKPDRTLVIDISAINGSQQNYGWYPDAYISKGIPSKNIIQNFLMGLDVVLIAETPLNYDFYDIAKRMGVKTAVVYNYEFFDWFKYPEYPKPDMLIAPSVWNFDVVNRWAKGQGIEHLYLHHPVDRNKFPFRLRTHNRSIHIAGKPATHDRNGTWEYLKAEPNAKIVTQSSDLAWQIRHRYSNSNVFDSISDPNYMYQLGDFMVLPRKYGGNCLPLNEALSSGMPVVMPDVSPNNHILPSEWLVPAEITGHFEPRTKIDLYTSNPRDLSDKIQWLKECDMKIESEKANKIADTISWETLKPKWIETLKGLKE